MLRWPACSFACNLQSLSHLWAHVSYFSLESSLALLGVISCILGVSHFRCGKGRSFYHWPSCLWIQQDRHGPVARVTWARSAEAYLAFHLVSFVSGFLVTPRVLCHSLTSTPSFARFCSMSGCCDFRLSGQSVFDSWSNCLSIYWMDHSFTAWLSSRLTWYFVSRQLIYIRMRGFTVAIRIICLNFVNHWDYLKRKIIEFLLLAIFKIRNSVFSCLG